MKDVLEDRNSIEQFILYSDPKLVGECLRYFREIDQITVDDIAECLHQRGWGKISETVRQIENGKQIQDNMLTHILCSYKIVNVPDAIIKQILLLIYINQTSKSFLAYLLESSGFTRGQTKIDIDNILANINNDVSGLQSKLESEFKKIIEIRDHINKIDEVLKHANEEIDKRATTAEVQKVNTDLKTCQAMVNQLLESTGVSLQGKQTRYSEKRTLYALWALAVAVFGLILKDVGPLIYNALKALLQKSP